MPLQLDDIVRVTASAAPGGARGREFGRGLFLTTDETLDQSGPGKVRTYANMSEVADVFTAENEPYKAAQTYFSQSPYPRGLVIARWPTESRPWVLTGGSAPALLATLKAITAGTLEFEGQTTATFDLSSATTLADIASLAQTAIRALAGMTEVEASYDSAGKRFSVSAPFPITGPLAGSAAGDFGLDTGAVKDGQTAESIAEAMEAIKTYEMGWYFVAVDSSIADTDSVLDVAAWVESKKHMLAADSHDVGALTAQEDTSLAARLSVLESERVFVVWSDTEDYKALSLAARFSTVNFDGANTLITGKFKSLPGTLSDVIDSASKRELDRKRINHYSPFGGDNILAEGWTLKPGGWIDVQFWLDWIVNRIQTDVYNLLRRHPTRVPQTREGLASIKSTIESVCEAGRRNGGIATGKVSESLAGDIRLATGNLDFDGTLNRGYLIAVGSFDSQSQQNRDERLSPPFRVFLKGSGAIHFADIELSFEN